MSIRLQPIVTIHITLIRGGVSFKVARHEQESETMPTCEALRMTWFNW